MQHINHNASAGTLAHQRGMSHTELMVAVALVMIMSVTALPGIDKIMDRNKVSDTRKQLLTDLNFAHNSALREYRRTVICPSNNQKSCTSGNHWRNGWIVFQDFDGDNHRTANERLLRTATLDGEVAISSGQRQHFHFEPDGTTRDSVGKLLLCHADDPDMGHRVIVTSTGRVISEEYACGKGDLG